MSRYKFKLQPAGVITPDLDLTLTLSPDGTAGQQQTGQGIGEVIPPEPPVDPCPTLQFHTFTVLSAVTWLGPSYGVDGNDPVPVIPYPPCCYSFRIYFSGCLPSGVTLSWVLADVVDDSMNIQLEPVYDWYNNVVPTAIGVFISNQTYDAWLLGSSFTLRCSDGTTQVGPDLLFACDAGAGTYRWASWYVYRWNPAAPNVAPDATYPEYNEEITTELWVNNGHIWGDYGAVNWTVTQTAGATANLTITNSPNGCRQWRVTRDTGVSYAGTAYELQADIAAVPFGDPITISCEV